MSDPLTPPWTLSPPQTSLFEGDAKAGGFAGITLSELCNVGPATMPPPAFPGQTLGAIPDLFSSFDAANGLNDIIRCYHDGLEIGATHRDELFSFLAHNLHACLSHARKNPARVTQAKILIELLCIGGFWCEQDFVRGDGMRRKFSTATAFTTAIYAAWGIGSTVDRVSHSRAAARMWLRLKAMGLKLPEVLGTLECIAHRGDTGIEIYAGLATALGRAPYKAEIEAVAAPKEAKAAVTRELARRRTRDTLLQTAQDLLAYVATLPAVDPQLQAIASRFAAAQALAQEMKQEAAELNQQAYAEEFMRPFRAAEGDVLEIDEDRVSITVKFQGATDAWIEKFRRGLKRIKGASDHVASGNRWFVTRAVNLENWSCARAQKAQIYRWAIGCAHQWGAPIPPRTKSLRPEEAA